MALLARILPLLAALLLAWAPALAEGPEAALRPEMEAVPLADFVRLAAPYLERPVVLEPGEAGSLPVSLYSARPLGGSELRALLAAVARAAGLRVAEEGGTLRLEPDGPPAGRALAVYRPDPRLPLSLAAQYAELLRSPEGRVEAAAEAGAVVLADGPQRSLLVLGALRKAGILARSLDTALVRLNRLSPEEAASRLDAYYWNLYVQGRVEHAPILAPLPWAGCLLAAAGPGTLRDVLDTLRRMDP